MKTPSYLSNVSLTSVEKREFIRKFLLRPPQPVPENLLFPLLFDLEKEVRLLAARALARVQHPAIFSYLVRMLNSPEMDEKLAAIRLFRYVRIEACALPLVECLTDPHPKILRALALTLMRLTPNAMILASQKFPDLPRSQKFEVLRAFSVGPHGGEPVLIKGLQDEDPWIRIEAIKAISRKKSDEVTSILINSLRDSFSLVRLEVVHALKERNHPDIQASVAPLKNDPDVAVAAAASHLLYKASN